MAFPCLISILLRLPERAMSLGGYVLSQICSRLTIRRYSPALVPYVKAGLTYHLWWYFVEGKTVPVLVDSTTSLYHPSQGGTLGLHGTLGLAINLDWLDPTAGRGGSVISLAGSYLFGEVDFVLTDGFGGRRLNLSGIVIQAGLNVDFE